MTALLVLTGPQAGRRLEVQGEAFIGRSPSCTLALDDARVSRRHVRLVVERGQARVADLGSRNGTLVNGERLEGEVVLLPGDRLQVGDSTMVFEPSAGAALSEAAPAGPVEARALHEALPVQGPEAWWFEAANALVAATSEAMVLRRAAEVLARGVGAARAAALLGGAEGHLTAAVVGAEAVEVPRALAQAAQERQEVCRAGGQLCAPLLASGGAPFGMLFAERVAPFDPEDVTAIAALGRLTGEALASARSRRWTAAQAPALIGASRQARKVLEAARRAAAVPEPVVISGEAGSGRTQVARYVHSRSARALGPLVRVDCRRAAAEVEAELFGRPSAPGAPPEDSALLRAEGGTLLLQHLEVLPRPLAERLARLLLRRANPARQGGEEPADVRVMVTASLPVEAMAARGEVDPELARALAGQAIETVPLRDRRPDVLPLLEHFAGEAARAQRREPPALSPDARRLLGDYRWPGNVAELRAVSERLALLYAGAEVTALHLPPEMQDAPGEAPARTLAERIARLERDAVSEALRAANGKKIRAAALLGISRPTLDKKIEEFNLVIEKRRP